MPIFPPSLLPLPLLQLSDLRAELGEARAQVAEREDLLKVKEEQLTKLSEDARRRAGIMKSRFDQEAKRVNDRLLLAEERARRAEAKVNSPLLFPWSLFRRFSWISKTYSLSIFFWFQLRELGVDLTSWLGLRKNWSLKKIAQLMSRSSSIFSIIVDCQLWISKK